MNAGLSLIQVLDGEAPKGEWSVSPSAVTTRLECERKWGYRAIAKLYAEPAPSALLGTDGHAQAEAFLGEGTPLDFSRPSGAIMQAGQHLWPQPKTPGMTLERKFRFRSTRTGFIYAGLKDVEIAPHVPQPQLGLEGDAPIVIDHKTTSSIEKYAKTEDVLLYDSQATIYGLDSMARYESPVVDLAWIYYQTKGARRAKPVTLRVELQHTLRVFDAVEQVAAEMARAREAFAASSLQAAPIAFVKKHLKANPAACGAYGGCPYQHLCNLSPAERMRSALSMSLIASLRSLVQGEPAPKVEEKPEPASLMGCSDRDVPAPPDNEIPVAFRDPPAEPKVQVQPVQPLVHVTVGDSPAKVDPINPPEAKLPPPPAPAPAESSEEKKGRGRPKGSKNKPSPASAPDAKVTVEGADEKLVKEVSADVADAIATSGKNVASQDGGKTIEVFDDKQLPRRVEEALEKRFHLFVDCLPDRADYVQYADVLVAKANEKIVAGGQVAHYKFLKFGEATGALTIALGEVLDEVKPSAVFCSGTSEALPILTARAAGITRSVR